MNATNIIGGLILAWLALDFLVLPTGVALHRKLRGRA